MKLLPCGQTLFAKASVDKKIDHTLALLLIGAFKIVKADSENINAVFNTVEPPYNGNQWDHCYCPF